MPDLLSTAWHTPKAVRTPVIRLSAPSRQRLYAVSGLHFLSQHVWFSSESQVRGGQQVAPQGGLARI